MSAQATDPRHELSAGVRDAVYKTRIAPRIFHNTEASPTPTLVIVAGEPGAGKSTLRDALKNELGAQGVAVIDQDAIRTNHPRFRALSLADDKTAAMLTNTDAGAWVERALDDARRRRVNVALESTMRNPEHALQMVKQFKAAGYRVEVRALAVPEQDSARGVLHRYELQKARGEPGRSVALEYQQGAYRALPETLRRLETEQAVDRVAVMRRSLQIVYDNNQVGGQWSVRPPIADRALAMERERGRTREELQQRAIEWTAVDQLVGARSTATAAERAHTAGQLQAAREEFREHQRKIPPPGRAEATQASLEHALRIAKTLGGTDAQLTRPVPGKSYKGPILGETAEHVVQGGATTTAFVAHAKRDLAETPAIARIVDVRYPAQREHQASVTEMKIAAPSRDVTADRER